VLCRLLQHASLGVHGFVLRVQKCHVVYLHSNENIYDQLCFAQQTYQNCASLTDDLFLSIVQANNQAKRDGTQRVRVVPFFYPTRKPNPNPKPNPNNCRQLSSDFEVLGLSLIGQNSAALHFLLRVCRTDKHLLLIIWYTTASEVLFEFISRLHLLLVL
jgi:hypothetical protein